MSTNNTKRTGLKFLEALLKVQILNIFRGACLFNLLCKQENVNDNEAVSSDF